MVFEKGWDPWFKVKIMSKNKQYSDGLQLMGNWCFLAYSIIISVEV